MAARCRLGILQSWLAVLQSCLSILQSRPVSPQSSPRRSSVLALYFDQLRAPFTESTPPAAAKSHASFTGSAPLLPPKPQSPIAGLLRCCRRSLTYLLRDLPRRGGLLVAKTKIPPFLQLFCDCGLPSIPKKRNRTATQLDHLRFYISIRNWKVLNNPQSQKSCTASRFFVFEPPGMASGRVLNIPGRQRCGGRLGPRGTLGAVLRTDDARWPRAVPQSGPPATLQNKKARASNFGCPRFVFKRCCAYPSTYALL